jgi:hypothetical protein
MLREKGGSGGCYNWNLWLFWVARVKRAMTVGVLLNLTLVCAPLNKQVLRSQLARLGTDIDKFA